MNSWEVRAEKFMRQFLPFIPEFDDIEDSDEKCEYVLDRVCAFNRKNHRAVRCEYGSARLCLITSDYVIKIDYNYDRCDDIGGCAREYEVYQELGKSMFGYLLAPMCRFVIGGRYYYAMMRVDGIGNEDWAEEEYGWTEDEREFLKEYMCDLHPWNVGEYHGKGIVVDYACSEGHWDFTEGIHLR